MISRSFWFLAVLAAAVSHAGPAPFDLAGPVLQAKITRGAVTLPASEVPNLAPGDRIWLRADLPKSQSAHYLLIAAFLRGSTNPPPANWFFPCKTWKDKCATDGLTLTVPDDAQQVLVFLAPQTGGDFKTLVGAVRGRPGAFVRTSQDLNQAALDRSRLERYLETIRSLNDADPAKLAGATPLLARSLAIKVDEKCLERLPELQAPCLMQGQESLILNDGHSTSIVEALTSGPGSDLAMEASYTPQLSYGYYSPYIASVLDIARIFDSFGTAQYQYIPALASARGDKLVLTLNAAPSFHDPKSVLVTALPAVEKTQLPPLHAVDPQALYCARRSALVLPVEGAPLVFSTGFAHDVTLTLTGADGKTLNLPATADATRGGYVVDTAILGSAALGDRVQAYLRGYWGFDTYEGPRFSLINARARAWALAEGEEASLIVGRQDTVHLRADSISCVDTILLKDPNGKELKVDWKSVKPDELEIKLPLQEARPGGLTLEVSQYGISASQPVPLQVFAEAGRFDGFAMHAGDSQGVLRGSRLDEVSSLTFKSVVFVPGELSSSAGSDELPMVAKDPSAASALKPELKGTAKVTLQDGRAVALSATVEGPRPRVSLIGKTVQPSATSSESNVKLADSGELPLDALLIFSIRSQSPTSFGHDETVEVATGDETSATTLSAANGGLTLENAHVAVATLDPSKAFAPSTFGPLKFRVSLKGVAGDWQPLANLVRLPILTALKCPPSGELACQLTGTHLFLIDSVSGDAQFTHPIAVPDGFLGAALPVPHPAQGSLYVKLRDNPAVVNPTLLAAQVLPESVNDERAASRRTAATASPGEVAGASAPLAGALPAAASASAAAPPPAAATTSTDASVPVARTPSPTAPPPAEGSTPPGASRPAAAPPPDAPPAAASRAAAAPPPDVSPSPAASRPAAAPPPDASPSPAASRPTAASPPDASPSPAASGPAAASPADASPYPAASRAAAAPQPDASTSPATPPSPAALPLAAPAAILMPPPRT
jgi:hypothetical protein